MAAALGDAEGDDDGRGANGGGVAAQVDAEGQDPLRHAPARARVVGQADDNRVHRSA